MWDLANALLRGLQIGSVYAIVGLGLNVIFAATGVFNFAQGELVMVGAMLGVSLWVASGFPLVVSLVLVVLVTASIGALTEILAVRRLSNQRDATLWMLSTLGVAIIIRSGAGILARTQIAISPTTSRPVLGTWANFSSCRNARS
jgi:branched-chain amino acid transport system permease protein